jgi:hypothetical protein
MVFVIRVGIPVAFDGPEPEKCLTKHAGTDESAIKEREVFSIEPATLLKPSLRLFREVGLWHSLIQKRRQCHGVV